jgi:DNA-binding NtrC family response regulator
MNSDDSIRVFLIEDNDDDAELVHRFLTRGQNVHFTVERADRLSSALERLSGEKYDVILSDLGLPDSWGLDTFVKVHSACPDIPVIILTGLDNETGALEAVHRGAQEYLVKSQMNSRNLVRVIRYSIERNELLVRLEMSLKEIKTLRGLLPMCAWCKNVRDDKGYWRKVEEYITELTGTFLTHGICPDCYEKFRMQNPDFLNEKTAKDE